VVDLLVGLYDGPSDDALVLAVFGVLVVCLTRGWLR
jgi:hypothetical protein